MEMLKSSYLERYNTVLIQLAREIEDDLIKHLKGIRNIDRIYSRPKSVDKFLQKADIIEENGKKRYSDPINQIQDQIGARIIGFYLDDIEIISKAVLNNYRHIELENKIPESEKEFGYEGQHLMLIIPPELKPDGLKSQLIPNFFELQIRTLFQHAFSEGSHDLAYKPGVILSKEQKRKVAFAAAQAWGGDLIFNELQREL